MNNSDCFLYSLEKEKEKEKENRKERISIFSNLPMLPAAHAIIRVPTPSKDIFKAYFIPGSPSNVPLLSSLHSIEFNKKQLLEAAKDGATRLKWEKVNIKDGHILPFCSLSGVAPHFFEVVGCGESHFRFEKFEKRGKNVSIGSTVEELQNDRVYYGLGVRALNVGKYILITGGNRRRFGFDIFNSETNQFIFRDSQVLPSDMEWNAHGFVRIEGDNNNKNNKHPTYSMKRQDLLVSGYLRAIHNSLKAFRSEMGNLLPIYRYFPNEIVSIVLDFTKTNLKFLLWRNDKTFIMSIDESFENIEKNLIKLKISPKKSSAEEIKGSSKYPWLTFEKVEGNPPIHFRLGFAYFSYKGEAYAFGKSDKGIARFDFEKRQWITLKSVKAPSNQVFGSEAFILAEKLHVFAGDKHWTAPVKCLL